MVWLTIVILFSDNTRSPTKPQRQIQGGRARLRSQRNYSSQSEDDSPQDRGHGMRRQRQQRYQQGKPSQQGNNGSKTTETVRDNPSKEDTFFQHKPPLPPFKTERPPSSSAEHNDEDGSWEDVTTSGNDSMGEDHSSVNSSPDKKELKSAVSMVANRLVRSVPNNECSGVKEQICYSFDKHLEKSCSIDKALESDLSSMSILKNSGEDQMFDINRIDKSETNYEEAIPKEQDGTIIEEENVSKHDYPPHRKVEFISNESCTTEQNNLEANIHKNAESTSSDGNEMNISNTLQVKENILEQNDNSPSNSRQKAAVSSENNEIVDLVVEDEKEVSKDEDSKSELQNDSFTQEILEKVEQIKD